MQGARPVGSGRKVHLVGLWHCICTQLCDGIGRRYAALAVEYAWFELYCDLVGTRVNSVSLN